jgi:hypothetical protein
MTRPCTHLIRVVVALASGATLGTVALGSAGAGAASPGSAGNSGANAMPATLSGIKAKAATDVTDRVNALNAAITKVNAAKGLGSGQSTLASYLGTDGAPLQQVNQTIQGDTTVAQAAKDFGTIFSDYRVYVLVLPASRIAAEADGATTTAIPALSSDATKAQARLNAGNQAELQPLIDDLNSQISTATNATNGLAATVLASTPAQWNDNHGLLGPSKTSVQAAIGALEKGRSDVRQIVQDLRGAAGTALHGRAGTTTTG